jgi:hypothetical protein
MELILLLVTGWFAGQFNTFLERFDFWYYVFIFDLHYIPLKLYPRNGNRGISDIPPRRPRFTKIT